MILITLLSSLSVSLAIFMTVASRNMVLQDEYPTTSLACKPFNKSVLDCSRRRLIAVPSIGNYNTTSVDLSDNKIHSIFPTAFARQTRLRLIDFTKNELINITGSPFADLSSLVYLNLTSNQLSSLASTAFTGLFNLEILDISANMLILLPDGVFRDLQSLKYLDLSTNQLITVPGLALSALCNLEVLILYDNPFTAVTFGPEFELLTHLKEFFFFSTTLRIPKLTNKTLEHLTLSPLRKFMLRWNQLTHVEAGIFENLKNIELLMSGVFSLEQQPFPVSSSVRSLVLPLFQPILTRNFFMPLSNLNESLTSLNLKVWSIYTPIEIEDFAFDWFPSLLNLDLSANIAEFEFSENTFYGLGQLKSLSLAQTMLTSIPSVALQAFAQTGSLRQLDLSGNMLAGSFPDDAFASVTSLEHLDLSDNPISNLNTWIERLTNLRRLFLSGGNTKLFYANRWETPIYSLIEFQLNHFFSDTIHELGELSLSQKAPNLKVLDISDTTNMLYSLSTIRNLTSLQHLDLSGSLALLIKNNLYIEWSSIFYPNLKVLKFARNQLETMTELILHRKTPEVVDVDLSSNLITSVDKDIRHLLNLQHLNLNDNQISSLDYFHTFAQIKSLRIAQNVITYVPVTVVKNLFDSKLEYLDISNNPFECTCAIKPFQDWILVDTWVYLEPNLYRCDGPIEYKDISVTQVKLDCRSYFRVHVSIAVTCGLIVFLMTLLTWRFRWHLRYRLFLLCNWHRVRYDDINREDNDFEMVEMQYDVFVSYAHESDNDLEWVLNEMRPNLEEGPEPIRLCIGHARDFIPGTNLYESISEAIHQTRKTIVVLSPSYVDSELCYHEILQAWQRLIDERRDVLILILLEPIPDEKMTIWLRKLLCKKGFLTWPQDRVAQRLFWRCVREKIKKRTLVNRRFDK